MRATTVAPAADLHLPLLPASTEVTPCGFPSPAQDYLGDGDLDLAEWLELDRPGTYLMRVAGHSMAPTILDGALLVVNRETVAADGVIVVAEIDGELTVKRLRMDARGPRLEADNPAHPAVTVDELSELRVWGVVTAIIHDALKP